MRGRLRHRSSFPGSEGGPGEVVDVNDELGQRWLDSKGAVPCDDEPARSEPVGNVEPVDEAPAPEAPKPATRPRRKKSAKRRGE